MYAQLCCCGPDDGRTVKVPDPAPDIWRVPKKVEPALGSEEVIPELASSYDEYKRDGITAAGLIRYTKVKNG